MMPGIDGYEVCRRIRADPATAFVPVIMVTASGEAEKRRGLDAGADDFVTKPFDQAELLARVRSLLRVKAYHDEIEAFNRGLRRFLPPEVADAGQGRPGGAGRAPARDRGRRFCALAGFASFAETRRAGGRHRRPQRLPRGARRARRGLRGRAGAADGRRADGRLQRPVPVCGAGRARRSGSRSRCATACGSWRRAGAGSASTSSSPRAWPSATRPSAASGPSTAGSTPRSAPSPPSAERLCESAAPGQILISRRVFAATESLAITQPAGDLPCAASPPPPRPGTSSASNLNPPKGSDPLTFFLRTARRAFR